MTKRTHIDDYERELELRREGRMDERLFIESRLRRGVYGQRYDDGLRWDGKQRRGVAYPQRTSKGLGAHWDAPGMQRIKLPWGGLNPEQMEVIAELAEEYSDGIVHVTTRQDVQLHFVHIDDTPALMHRLQNVGVTTREACGNSIRNVTACPIAGVCSTEKFDVTPYAEAVARFLLGHPDVQAFGRKFKITFSGCREEACGRARMHDLGFIAAINEKGVRGFEVWVGGGLGAVPFEAKLMFDFLPEEELLPTTQAIARVFAEHGEKKNRGRARMKFLVEKLGLEEVKRLVLEARALLPFDPRFLVKIAERDERGDSSPPLVSLKRKRTPSFELWAETNVRPQKQVGFSIVTVTLPLGDLTSEQMRGLADVARRYANGNVRTTVEQNFVLRFVKETEVRALHEDLEAIGLAEAGAGTIADVTACPGTDTCRLGIASSRGLAFELRNSFAVRSWSMDQAVRKLRIKVSGCYNACAQHQLADIGFYGMSRKKDDKLVPHFQVVLGGRSEGNAAAYGMAIGAVPSKSIPRVVDRLATRFVRERGAEESFAAFVERIGRKEVKAMLADLLVVPEYAEDASFYSDFGDPREFTLDDHRAGEGAGQAISLLEIGLAASEREVFEAQLALEKGDAWDAAQLARASMFTAARALVRTEIKDVPADEEVILAELCARFVDRGRIGDHARFIFKKIRAVRDLDEARRRIGEAQLFIEAAHQVEVRS